MQSDLITQEHFAIGGIRMSTREMVQFATFRLGNEEFGEKILIILDLNALFNQDVRKEEEAA
jgi:hypothetical protein